MKGHKTQWFDGMGPCVYAVAVAEIGRQVIGRQIKFEWLYDDATYASTAVAKKSTFLYHSVLQDKRRRNCV